MAKGIVHIAPVRIDDDITPTDGAWNDYDLSSYVDGTPAGVILEFFDGNGSTTWGVQHNSSSDDITGSNMDDHHYVVVGCDSSTIIEI